MEIGIYSPPAAGHANPWLIEERGRFMAVDVGTRRDAQLLVRYMKEELMVEPNRLTFITSTHFHYDHIGGIEELLRLCPGSRVHFGKLVRDYIEGDKVLAVPSLRRWIRGLVPIVFGMPRKVKGTWYGMLSPHRGIPLPLMRRHNRISYDVDCDLIEGESPGDFTHWRVVETPGHTPDSLCFYCEKEGVLIAGDTILNMRGGGELNYFCTHPEGILSSYERLLSLSVSSLYPGHGAPILGVNKVLENVSLRGFETWAASDKKNPPSAYRPLLCL